MAASESGPAVIESMESARDCSPLCCQSWTKSSSTIGNPAAARSSARFAAGLGGDASVGKSEESISSLSGIVNGRKSISHTSRAVPPSRSFEAWGD
jgi:hypothetical protein